MAKRREEKFGFCGGHLALDFVNTVDWRLSESAGDRLATPSDLIAWCRKAEILSTAQAAAIRKRLGRSKAFGEGLLARAIDVRELIYRLLEALLHDRSPGRKDIADFNQFLQSLESSIEWKGDRYDWKRSAGAAETREILEPIVRAAAELMTSELAVKVAQCEDDRGCGWLFLDRSRSKPRRWCSMQDCGNRDKVRRYYQRLSEQ